MRSHLRSLIAIAFSIALTGAAGAVIGNPPLAGAGPALPDSTWLNAVAAGLNGTYQSGLVAAGTNQATALQLLAGYTLVEVDTTASSTGIALPAAIAGIEISIYNNGLQTLSVYPSITNNGVTAAQDTINNGTSFSGGVATHVQIYCFTAKTGVWACK